MSQTSLFKNSHLVVSYLFGCIERTCRCSSTCGLGTRSTRCPHTRTSPEHRLLLTVKNTRFKRLHYCFLHPRILCIPPPTAVVPPSTAIGLLFERMITTMTIKGILMLILQSHFPTNRFISFHLQIRLFRRMEGAGVLMWPAKTRQHVPSSQTSVWLCVEHLFLE